MRALKSGPALAAFIFGALFLSLPFLFIGNPAVEDTMEKYIQSPFPFFAENPLGNHFHKILERYKSLLGGAGKKERAARAAAESRSENARQTVYIDGRGPYEIVEGVGGKKYVDMPEGMIPVEMFMTPEELARAQAAAAKGVTLNGLDYEIFTDKHGRKFVIMGETNVPYEDFMRTSISTEQYDAVKKAAPALEDWQIIEAVSWADKMNYRGGAENFLASGDYDRLSRNGTRSIFHPEEGKRLSVGGGEPIPLGGKGPLMHKDKNGNLTADLSDYKGYNKGGGYGGQRGGARGAGRQSAAVAAVAAKMAAGNKAQNTAKQQNVNERLLAQLRLNLQKPIVGDNPQEAGFKEPKRQDISLDLRQQEPVSEKKIIKLKEGNVNIIPENEDLRQTMTEKFFCGGRACKASQEFTGNFNGQKPVTNPWLLPKQLGENKEPGEIFYTANGEAFEIFGGKDVNNEFLAIDKKYKYNYVPAIINELAKVKQPVTIAILDSVKNNEVRGLPDDNYYWQTVNYLFTDRGNNNKSMARNFAYLNGREGALNELVYDNPSSRPNILVVPNKYLEDLYKQLGYNVVMFDGVPTPDNLNNFAEEIIKATQRWVLYDMESERKTAEAKQSLTKGKNMPQIYRSVRGTVKPLTTRTN
ncbi:MAG: hypothetical protein LBL61_06270 [Elusimicrobiota bacterium]|nr:hypothetical protein [Elusimicrobiota bacterium]